MIEVSGLTKFYGNIPAIQNVSFTVARGEILGFLGPNAAGKTTTMRILAGYLPPSSGTATVAGHDVWRDSLEVRRRVGYLPETVPLYGEMTVRSYLTFFAKLRGVRSLSQRLDYVLGACGLAGQENQVIGRLSRGYRQRVGIAQALIHDPEVLILDEPTVGLDPRQITEVRSLIRSLGGEHTVILSTHILSEVGQTCSRVLIINEGRIVAEDSPQQLSARLSGGQRVSLRVQQPAADAAAQLAQISGVISVSADSDGRFLVDCTPGMECRPQLASLAVEQGWGVLELHAHDVSLEEVFLRLTSDTESSRESEAAN
ncbi:MAG: ABC transporter ATP-binding protein [Anaerolineae bacterium]